MKKIIVITFAIVVVNLVGSEAFAGNQKGVGQEVVCSNQAKNCTGTSDGGSAGTGWTSSDCGTDAVTGKACGSGVVAYIGE